MPLWKVVWGFLKTLGIKPPYDPAILLLAIYPEEIKTENEFISALSQFPYIHVSI